MNQNLIINEYSNFNKKEQEKIYDLSATNSLSENYINNVIKKEGKYVRIVKSCDISFDGGCARARACP